MNDQSHDPKERSQQRARRLAEQAARLGQVHETFLAQREEGLRQIAHLTRQEFEQLNPADRYSSAPQPEGNPRPDRPAMISADQLREFAEGDILKCLGPAYAVYRSRRTPRIPRGDLLLMSRVMSLTGQPGRPDLPADIEVEYDVPAEAWYLRGDAQPGLPYAIWMEIALQPCGFLTAYLETPLQFPQEDFFFRNLDGDARLLSSADPRGKTLVTQARLERTSLSGGVIVQRFSFAVSLSGQPVFTGHSVFGYFPPRAMQNQVGLEGGVQRAPWLEQTGGLERAIALGAVHGPHRLDDLDQVWFVPQGGLPGLGYVYARKEISPSAWFYGCHFLEDPVMPGSLGVESAFTALRLAGQQIFRLPAQNAAALSLDEEVNWKYRGQILPANRKMELEVHVSGVERQAAYSRLWGDATLWIDRTRIYKINHISLNFLSAD